jgi:hypothetical protein
MHGLQQDQGNLELGLGADLSFVAGPVMMPQKAPPAVPARVNIFVLSLLFWVANSKPSPPRPLYR